MKPERLVFDTNVLISSFFSTTSTPALAVEQALRRGRLLASTDTLRELTTRSLSPKFDRYVPRETREIALVRLGRLIEIVEIADRIQASRDPYDDKFLEVAINGHARVIVTGDADLLVLHPFRKIAILTPAQYIERPATVESQT